MGTKSRHQTARHWIQATITVDRGPELGGRVGGEDLRRDTLSQAAPGRAGNSNGAAVAAKHCFLLRF